MMKGKSTNRCRCDYETFVGKLIEFFPYQRPHNADQGTKKKFACGATLLHARIFIRKITMAIDRS